MRQPSHHPPPNFRFGGQQSTASNVLKPDDLDQAGANRARNTCKWHSANLGPLRATWSRDRREQEWQSMEWPWAKTLQQRLIKACANEIRLILQYERGNSLTLPLSRQSTRTGPIRETCWGPCKTIYWFAKGTSFKDRGIPTHHKINIDKTVSTATLKQDAVFNSWIDTQLTRNWKKVQVQMSDEFHSLLKDYANAWNMTTSEVMHECTRHHMNKHSNRCEYIDALFWFKAIKKEKRLSKDC